MIELDNLVKRFPCGNGESTILDHINLHIDKGETVGIKGGVGSGKTLLLHIIGCIEPPTDGHVSVMGQDLASLNVKEAAEFRNGSLSFIFQNSSLMKIYSVYENVEAVLLSQGLEPSLRKSRVMRALEYVGLADKADRRPSELSGGECQLLSIACALVKKPELVLADEPCANLDPDNLSRILDVMELMNKELGTTFVIASHDERVLSRCRRIVTLEKGQISISA